jgi:hypothetical protein
MNLQTMIQDALWEAIYSNYEKRNYTGAVLDAVHFLSDVLRAKSATEGDGAALIGQALGGLIPRSS